MSSILRKGETKMFKKRLACIVSLILLMASTAFAAGSLVPRQSARAVKFSRTIATAPTSIGAGGVAADSFQRTISSGWGSSDTAGWWTVVGSP